MELEKFYRGNSVLHVLDTRIKLVAAIFFSFVTAISTGFISVTAGLCFAIVLVGISRISVADVGKRLFVVNGFTLFIWLVLPLTYPGAEKINFGPLFFSLAGLRLASLITLKTNSIVLACIALLTTSTVVDMGYGMQKLFIPKKLSLLLLFSYRYIILIYEEFKRLGRAAQLRCFSPGTDIHTYRTFGYLFGMTLVKSWQRAERVNEAMVLRGFEGTFYSLNESFLERRDIFIGGILVLVPVLLAGLEVWY